MVEKVESLVERCLTEVRARLADRLSEDAPGEEEIHALIEEAVFRAPEDLGFQELTRVAERVHAGLFSRLGPLQPFLDDPRIHEIMVNGPDRIFCEYEDGIYPAEVRFGSPEELEDIIRNTAADVRREINELHPILDARLPDGSRVNAVWKNVAAEGPSLTIRKFARERITLAQMEAQGTLTSDCACFLRDMVRKGANLFISGGTSSGKTTFLNALCDAISAEERVVVIEDSRELMLPQIRNLVQMECHQANAMGKGSVTMEMLIRTSLRMRPDRIIVGEIRDRSVSDMLQAMNTGHSGISTGHGNSVRGMLRRLEAMYLMGAQIPMDAIRAQIVEGLDLMVHLVRLGDGRRCVAEVQELCGFRDGEYVLNPLFIRRDGCLQATGNQFSRMERFWRGEEEYEREDREGDDSAGQGLAGEEESEG